MAMTQEYMDFLNKQVGIAPANSQEELQAAQTIAGVIEGHGIHAELEEFEAPALGGLGDAIKNIIMTAGVVLCGIGVVASATPLLVIGFILALVPFLLFVLSLFGISVPQNLGPKARSQNVVAVHRAQGPLVSKGNRPIVVVAHYDSPHENLVYSSPLAAQLPLITRIARYCAAAVALCALLMVIGAIPRGARIVFWVLGLAACAPGVFLAVGSVSERVSPCTLGSNDNKASVAALLAVLENVRPSGVAPVAPEPTVDSPADIPAGDVLGETSQASPLDEPEFAAQAAPAETDGSEAAAPAFEVEQVVGVRHGEKTLRELQILPETCRIEYVEPARREVRPAQAVSQAAAAEPAPAPTAAPAPVPAPAAQPEPVTPAAPAETASPAATAPTAPIAVPVPSEVAAAEQPAGPAATGDLGATMAQAGTGFSLVMDGDASEGRGVGPKDSSGITTLDDATADLGATVPSQPLRPEAPSDPEWGKTNYRPQLSSVARRASLFDLPDPAEGASDPFATDPHATRVAPRQIVPPTLEAPAPVSAPAPAAPAAVAMPAAQAPAAPAAADQTAPAPEVGEAHEGGIRGFFARLKHRPKGNDTPSDESWLGSADDDSDDEAFGSWRGGATTRSGLRLVEDDAAAAPDAEPVPAASAAADADEASAPAAAPATDEPAAPTEEDLRDAVLGLGDDALIAHDIWFVALGASALDHAGMKAFLAHHRSDIRGCFLVNLDCVGAGALTVLSHEGEDNPRRADRRLCRLLINVASDLHVDLAQKSYDWATTDATPAMRASRRSATIMGMGMNGLPALSRTSEDDPSNVDARQAANVAAIVTEAIRRS